MNFYDALTFGDFFQCLFHSFSHMTWKPISPWKRWPIKRLTDKCRRHNACSNFNPTIVLIINPLVTTKMNRSYWYELGHFLPGEKSVCQLSGVRLYDGEDRVCINNVFYYIIHVLL